MSDKALKRYVVGIFDLRDDDPTFDYPGKEPVRIVLADDAAREIEQLTVLLEESRRTFGSSTFGKELQGEIERLETALTRWQAIHDALVDVLEGRETTDDHTLVVATKQLRERVRELEGELSSNENWATVAHTIEKQYMDKFGPIQQERDHLREALKHMWNAFDNGKRKHFRDPIAGRCAGSCQACAIEKAQAVLLRERQEMP